MLKKSLLLAVCAAVCLSTCLVSAQSVQDRLQRLMNPSTGAWTADQIATMAKLRDAAMQAPYALTELRHLTDNIGPRLSGSPQAQKAVEYVADEMRALGADVHLEKTSVIHWVRGTETGELVSWPGMAEGTTQKIVLTALGPSVATSPDGLVADVVVADSFDALRKLPEGAVKGKILLLNEKFDKRLAAQGDGLSAYGQAVVYRGAGPSVAASLGALAVLVRSVGNADYRLPHTGATVYANGLPKIPAAAVTAEDADLLANLTQQGPVRMRLTLTPQTLPNVDSYNVIADWKGSEHPEQVVIVSGHLDSWDLATGAIDDGAGIVVSMQAIHLLQKLGIHPKRTVRFVAWMDEEQGGEGAATYAKDHASDLSNHIGALESDLGAGHPIGILAVGKPELAEWLRPVGHVLEPIGAATITPSPEAGEDIDSLKGVPQFAPNQDSRFYFNYHHTAADTFDKVNPQELNENAAVMVVLAYALADSSTPAPR
ncbi:M20/M25/M40 family metallo-hydrolase [Alloacidobacterium sp.]|uniref:M20/M25/M40 family metallo-hydrolase n=1 Tax=Alloacidobacterium sp. TaxID=2951999 RepID=UPI002D269BA9|nr:M20/M25/M40 family metallo-hydrolase [Alloacidobacterium sp.]HYK35092.1 M20/M25/M40 family metallo-hydrolase [Alloacidobacterium sp.]